MSSVIRDFSQEAIADIRELIKENVDEEKQFFLWDWIDDRFKMDDLDIQDYINDVNNYQKHMVDKHNINSKKFDKIIERVQTVDTNYAKRFNTIYESMISFNNKILKVSNMISPEGITLNSDIYDSVITGVERLHNKDIDYLKYDLEDFEDEMPSLRDIPWYEKALNGIGGTAVSLVRDNIEGLCFIPYAVVDGLFQTDLNHRLGKKLDDIEEYLIDNVVSDKEYYYYGKTVGNVVCMVEGIAFIAGGITTIAGGITLLGGGAALSATGIGAIFGGPAIAISVPVVAVGAMEISFGAGVFYSSMNNLKDNISKAKDAKASKVDDAKLNDNIKELDGKVKEFKSHYLSEGELKPNMKYMAGEYNYKYETDELGRISKFETDNLKLTERESRLPHDSNTPGKLEGDHAGHLAGDRFGGSPELDNLVSQSSNVNLSQYKKLENQWAKSINDGKQVKVKVEIKYDGNSLRPSEFNVKYEIDGKRYRQSILN